ISILQAPKLTTFNGQLATVHIGRTQDFTTGIKVFEKDGSGSLQHYPEHSMHFLGSGFGVQSVVSADRKSVAMKVRMDHSELAGPVALEPVTINITPVFEGGSKGTPIPFTQYVQRPNIQSVALEKSVSIPVGCTVLFDAGPI